LSSNTPKRASAWPGGRECAVSLCFDDGAAGQLDHAVPALDARGLHATFYLNTGPLESLRAETREKTFRSWRRVQAAGHEIGNHTRGHPAPTNFQWTEENAHVTLESLSLADIEEDIDTAQRFLTEGLGVAPQTFAYPCGVALVGRGETCQSYVPAVAKRFLVGRTYHDECPASPWRCDLARVPALGMDASPLSHLLALVDAARTAGEWLVLVAHTVVEEVTNPHTIERKVLEGLLDHLSASRTRIWTDTVRAVGSHVRQLQTQGAR